MRDAGYFEALRDVSLWVASVAMKPDMDPHTLLALNAVVARLAAEAEKTEAA